ncbi:MAG: hypothetical protein ABSC56_10290 [Solirubrobacteraceae bacterium]
MADVVHELLVTESGLEKPGARGISAEDAEQIPRSLHVAVRNSHAGGEPGTRRLLIGVTDGGRALALVIEQTVEPSTWLIVTGWNATDVELRLLAS